MINRLSLLSAFTLAVGYAHSEAVGEKHNAARF